MDCLNGLSLCQNSCDSLRSCIGLVSVTESYLRSYLIGCDPGKASRATLESSGDITGHSCHTSNHYISRQHLLANVITSVQNTCTDVITFFLLLQWHCHHCLFIIRIYYGIFLEFFWACTELCGTVFNIAISNLDCHGFEFHSS